MAATIEVTPTSGGQLRPGTTSSSPASGTTTGANSNSQGTTSSAASTPVSELYSANPGTQNASAGSASATHADASGVNYGGPGMSADAAKNLNDITSENSPLMQEASQQGLLSAASRGLLNSSIASGAAEASMAAAATPLAEQNASTAATANLQNAQLGTQVSEQNANNETAVSEQNAQLGTQVSEQNASQANTMAGQVLGENATINQTFLQGSMQQQLASINDQYQELIQTNQTAGNLYQAYFGAMQTMMGNEHLTPDRIASSINALSASLSAGLSLIQQLSGNTNPVAANMPQEGVPTGQGGNTNQGPITNGVNVNR